MKEKVIKLKNNVSLRITSPVFNGRPFKFGQDGKRYVGTNAVVCCNYEKLLDRLQAGESLLDIINEALEEYRKENNYDIAFLHKEYRDFFGSSFGAILARRVEE